MKQLFCTMFAGVLALLLLVAGPARADVLDQNKVGAALAILIVTDTNTITSAIVTNTSPTDPVILAGEVISGDSNDNWSGQSFRCPMTPGETTQFVFSSSGSGSTMRYECSNPDAGPFSGSGQLSIAKTMGTKAAKGILWLTIEDRAFPFPTLSKNVLEGKSTVVDFTNGTAYEVGAVPFQSPAPETQDFDKYYEFNGQELAEFPESLTASFHAPVVGLLDATLILFTLDGRLSSTSTPNPQAVMYFFNDDEEFFNSSVYFDCFAMLELGYIDSRFLRSNLGSQVGHLEIIPQSVDPADANHDGVFGNNDDKRVIPILGWLVQTLHDGGTIQDAQAGSHGPILGDAAWGSLLSTSITPLPNEAGDSPGLRR
ncbi:MAG: hypothetical protein GY722_02970 [bacterium]|nr:hypothetical protein [bacterium]